MCAGLFTGVLYNTGRPDLLLQKGQTSLQEACSHTEDMKPKLFTWPHVVSRRVGDTFYDGSSSHYCSGAIS